MCELDGLGECTPALDERCNGADDDCDGVIDEDFLDSQGRFVNQDHCGGCGMRCVAPGPHMTANCVANFGSAVCQLICDAGYVEVDQIPATGCECQLMDGPGVVIGGDANCDGVIDETPQFVFVSQAGDDDAEGVDFDKPLATLQAGLQLAGQLQRDMLVARGIYEGPVELLDGVSIYGGYSPDFMERDTELHPVLIEAPDSSGAPVLVGRGITTATRIDGLTLHASEAEQPGGGSTGVFLDGCTDALHLSRLTIVAARGAAGLAGEDSSAGLEAWGLNNLGQLAGGAGAGGRTHNAPGQACSGVVAGAGFAKQCFGGNVSGGNGGAAACPTMAACLNVASPVCGTATCDTDAVSAYPNPVATSGRGNGGGAAGDRTYNSPTNRCTCNFCDDSANLLREGDDGQDGGRGNDGRGGAGCGSDVPTLDLQRGLASAEGGADGSDGSNGAGGGGGSGGAGYAVIANTTGNCGDISGGSGGGGGSGGCGAPAARGGGGGGASIGLLIRLAAGTRTGPRMEAIQIITASGGDGGDGGVGAEGGAPGGGGLGGAATFWCSRNGGRGGDGGAGGDGGGGGGGCGGGSYGHYIEPANLDASGYRSSVQAASSISTAGIGGRRGRSGYSPGNAGGAGLDGPASSVFLGPPN